MILPELLARGVLLGGLCGSPAVAVTPHAGSRRGWRYMEVLAKMAADVVSSCFPGSVFSLLNV